MSAVEALARLLGIEEARSIREVAPSFAAPWAHDGPAWVLFGCLALGALSALFYLRAQRRGRPRARALLCGARTALLSLLLLILAEPVLTLQVTSRPKPDFWILFDGTDSMAIEDRYPEEERARLATAAGLETEAAGSPGGPSRERGLSRVSLVRGLLSKKEGNLLEKLAERFQLRAFIFDGAEGARPLDWFPAAGESLDPRKAAGQLTTGGEVTALGAALSDLSQRQASGNLAALLVVSDFDQNSGPSAVEAARRLGVPVYTLGVGPRAAMDLAVELKAPLLLKKGERASLQVALRQSGLEARSVKVRLTARRLGGTAAAAPSGSPAGTAAGAAEIPIAERAVELREPNATLEIPYTPGETGRFVLTAEVDPLQGEIVDQNNRSQREVAVRDDFLRLLFLEYEPTWEWRFIKEVFHRDKLVGMRGFRTFLRSADPKVRQSNPLFLPGLTPSRSDFFANDVIFLGDMPATALSLRFSEMTREFVSKFGGGLVVLSGPRFGPGQLASTPLADMLPVVVQADLRVRDEREFRLQLTAEAGLIDFMKLGSDEAESRRAWANLGPLPWYQPVARLHPLATALAVHPSDTCVDQKSPEPIIALRRYGRGEVVYLGLNETWRLRRRYGELYYRQFWGQMIHRLGLSHALGSEKRFVVRTDRQDYRADDQVTVTVEAYDENFEPLTAEKLPEGKLTGELAQPAGGRSQPVAIPLQKEGVFEARFPVLAGGEHRLLVKDPVTGEMAEVSFQVANLSAERRSAVRNAALEEEIALATRARSFGIDTVSRLPEEVQTPARVETSVRVIPLWNTWLFFALVVVLMLGEWLTRKLVNLP